MNRCSWCCDDGIVQKYHDEEWGTPLHDDIKHFEYLLMEAMQCGLSWTLMLKKREIFRSCFAGFDFEKVALMTEDDVEKIVAVDGMIRSKPKVRAIINNAKCFLDVIEEYGSFDNYLWSFSDHKTHIYRSHQQGLHEARNELSDKVAKDMKMRGFKYLGSITIFSHLQSCGIINDHDIHCWKYEADKNKSDYMYID